MVGKKTGLQANQAETRLLLALWDMGGSENKVKRKDLNDRLGRKKDNSEDYDKAYQQLEKDGAIAIVTDKRVVNISLSEEGVQKLSEGLNSPEFEFGSQIGAKTANALLKWMRSTKTAVNGAASIERDKGAIASYDDFQSKILDLFEKLNNTHNYSGLVPIWHLRRELGEQVSRENFNEWMTAMQGDQMLYLQSGEARGATDDQKQDSINSDIRGLLFFASKPS